MHLKGKSIIFCGNPSDARLINKLVQKSDLNFFVVIISNSEVEGILSKCGVPYATLSSYLPEKSISDKLDDRSEEISQEWYKCTSFHDELNYRRINYGEMVNGDIFLAIRKVLDDIVILENIIKKEKPRRLIILSSDMDYKDFLPKTKLTNIVNAAKLVCGKHGISFLRIKRFTLPFSKNLKTNVFQSLIKTGFQFFALILFRVMNNEGTQDKKVIIYEGSYFQSVIDILVQRRDISVLSINTDTNLIQGEDLGNRLLRNLQRLLRSIEIYEPSGHKSKIESERKRLQNLFKNLRNDPEFLSVFTFNGINIWEAMENRYIFLFEEYLPKIAEIYELSQSMFQIEKPDVFVTWTDCISINKTVVTIANNLNISTLVIQHGAIGLPLGYIPVTASKIAAWGEIPKQWFIDNGVESEKIVITGNPAFDSLSLRKGLMDKNEVCKKFDLDPTKNLILYALNYKLYSSSSFQKIMIRKLLDSVEQIPNTQLVIKFHPEFRSLYRNEYRVIKSTIDRRKNPNVKTTIWGRNIRHLINICDVCIIESSTTGLEAINLEKPLIHINLDPNFKIITPYQQGGVSTITNENDIVPTIKRILEDNPSVDSIKTQKDFLLNYCYKADGKASERVANLIEKLG